MPWCQIDARPSPCWFDRTSASWIILCNAHIVLWPSNKLWLIKFVRSAPGWFLCYWQRFLLIQIRAISTSYYSKYQNIFALVCTVFMMMSSNGNIFHVTGQSPHKGQWRGALMFPLICVWINSWENNREAGDLRCCRAHYDVTVMLWKTRTCLWYLVKTTAVDGIDIVLPEYSGFSTRRFRNHTPILCSLPWYQVKKYYWCEQFSMTNIGQ